MLHIVSLFCKISLRPFRFFWLFFYILVFTYIWLCLDCTLFIFFGLDVLGSIFIKILMLSFITRVFILLYSIVFILNRGNLMSEINWLRLRKLRIYSIGSKVLSSIPINIWYQPNGVVHSKNIWVRVHLIFNAINNINKMKKIQINLNSASINKREQKNAK